MLLFFDRQKCMLVLLSIPIGSNEIKWVKAGLAHMMFTFFSFQRIEFFSPQMKRISSKNLHRKNSIQFNIEKIRSVNSRQL